MECVALDSDEYGNPRPGLEPTRYNWLGAKRRWSETLTGLVLMGVRLSTPLLAASSPPDPVYGGNANAYAHADPLNRYVICAATAGAGCIVAGFVLAATSGSIDCQARFLFQWKKRMVLRA
ncbi:hypothetical protein [Streptomyces sp. NPDC127105]|uniref:hypothetical protein n=1 Tax=Streptomyces sp. NPDC127105 TaxID=3345359 RepID=UPI003657A339